MTTEETELFQRVTGDVIREARKGRGLTQAQLEALAGLNLAQFVSRVEKGMRGLRDCQLYSIARALGVEPGPFFSLICKVYERRRGENTVR